MEPNTKKIYLRHDDATHLLLSVDTINTKKANEMKHGTFCTYLKEKNYGDLNFENCSPETWLFPVIVENMQ